MQTILQSLTCGLIICIFCYIFCLLVSLELCFLLFADLSHSLSDFMSELDLVMDSGVQLLCCNYCPCWHLLEMTCIHCGKRCTACTCAASFLFDKNTMIIL